MPSHCTIKQALAAAKGRGFSCGPQAPTLGRTKLSAIFGTNEFVP